MERLTCEGNYCELELCSPTLSGHYCSGYCSNRKVWERLKAYEDTGLTPEDCTEYKKFEDEIIASGKTFGRLIELLEADRGGRVVVLPCKVGQRVFALLSMSKHISECEVKRIRMADHIGIGFIGSAVIVPISACGHEYGVSLKAFGKTVFLTREEAEKAAEVRNA